MIIGIVGRTVDPNGNRNSSGAGKDTVADIIAKTFDFQHMSLAAPMKHFAEEVLGFPHDHLWGPSSLRAVPNSQGVTPRQALQTLGTEWGRALDPDIWIRYLLSEADRLPRVVVSDVRFVNELRAIQEHPRGKIVLVERRVTHAIEPMQHQSERDLDSLFEGEGLAGALYIGNSRTLEALQQNVLWAFESMLRTQGVRSK